MTHEVPDSRSKRQRGVVLNLAEKKHAKDQRGLIRLVTLLLSVGRWLWIVCSKCKRESQSSTGVWCIYHNSQTFSSKVCWRTIGNDWSSVFSIVAQVLQGWGVVRNTWPTTAQWIVIFLGVSELLSMSGSISWCSKSWIRRQIFSLPRNWNPLCRLLIWCDGTLRRGAKEDIHTKTIV